MRRTRRFLNEAGIDANIPRDLMSELKDHRIKVRYFEVLKFIDKKGNEDFIVDIDIDFGNGVRIKSNFDPRDESEELRPELIIEHWGRLGQWNSEDAVFKVMGEVKEVLNAVDRARIILAILNEYTVGELMIVK